MGVRETLNKIENMVATAKTFPFTGHILINDNDLVHYVEELRNDCLLYTSDAADE